MEENIIEANEKERKTYTEILKSYSNRTRASFPKTKSMINFPNKAVFKICEMCEKYPEEEVLFLYNAYYVPDKQLTYAKTGEEALLIPNFTLLPPMKGFKCNPINILYLLINVILFVYAVIISIQLFYLYFFWLNVRFSAFVFISILLVLGLAACSFLGIVIYLRIYAQDSTFYAYYGVIGFDIILTIYQLITMNWKAAITYELFYWIDYRIEMMYALYGSLIVFEVIDVILHYFFVDNLKRVRKNRHWKSR